ncbi:MAG: 1-deoxy-D-xylulose-5-phosphate reductoisomerase [Gammaproteobacteria bacterium RIFCSPLOWO2_02_FULL_61_13]|nr:MAG: 1-deoxy-D-xylulose-5-phosphate reductoisomerase [Gammaproteobacteria bacterium RIFCSPLOWO2_02_FULL_61_13]
MAIVIGITVLGSTGSIGASTLDVIRRHPDRYRLIAISANSDVERMRAQCVEWQPRFAVMSDAGAAERLRGELRQVAPDVEILSGAEGLIRVAALDEVQYVMAAIVGAAGLLPTLAAARAGKRVLLANKEALVMSGRLFMDAVRQHGAELLPIDSEHNAIFQCMPPDFHAGLEQSGVRHILLTASGGPFRSTPLAELEQVTPDQACAHPNWVMGRKISVDSATMMNKGLEVIEACWLFNARPDQIEVVIHPQSVIHSLVQYADGSVLAQLGNPDMRTPIAHALAWPSRMDSGVAPLDLFQIARLDFERPDLVRFPCLKLAWEALRAGGTATTVLNAANEVAVAAFLAREIPFTGIARIVADALGGVALNAGDTLDQVLAADAAARAFAATAARRWAA